LALAIRKHVVDDVSLQDMAAQGSFADVRRADLDMAEPADADLAALLAHGAIEAFLRTAVRAGKTIVISGGTATGKTTFLNALLREVPSEERILLIEDTPEVRLHQPNAVGMVAVKGDLGEAKVGVDELMPALRMRPDRLMVGEIRGREAFSFLRAVNTGHPGSMTTVHADSPRGALDQIAFMALQAGVNLSRAEVIAYAREVVDVIVQLTRQGGRRKVAAIAFGRNVQV
jgi:type IV secretion system protein VirB11